MSVSRNHTPNVRRPPDPHDLLLARKEGGRAAHESEIGIEAAVDVFVRKNIHRDDAAGVATRRASHVLGCSRGRLRRNVKAARSPISLGQRTSAAIHFVRGRRIQLGHLPLERLALVQQPELQSRAVDGPDALAVEPARGDPGPHVLVDFATGNGMNRLRCRTRSVRRWRNRARRRPARRVDRNDRGARCRPS